MGKTMQESGMNTEATIANIEIVLNGAPYSVPLVHTLTDLIDALALSNQALALAVNRTVVRRQDWPQQVLAGGDQVDIVRAIGGG
ncbi:MAG: sulfur carrier protein [Janthinobacterium sp.]|jgi:sulfur carrier protein